MDSKIIESQVGLVYLSISKLFKVAWVAVDDAAAKRSRGFSEAGHMFIAVCNSMTLSAA